MNLYFAKVITKMSLPKLSYGTSPSGKNLKNGLSDKVCGVHCPVSSSALGEQLGDHTFLNDEAMLKD